MFKSFYNTFFKEESEEEPEPSVEEEPSIQEEPSILKETQSGNYLISIDGIKTNIESKDSSECIAKYFPSKNPARIEYGDSNEIVVYDPYTTQPPSLYNKYASAQTLIDIYGDALILCGKSKIEDKKKEKVVKKKRKRKVNVAPIVRRKSSRLAAKEKG